MSLNDPFHGSPRLCSMSFVVVDVSVVMHREKFFTLCKGVEDRDRFIESYRDNLKDRFGSNMDIFIDYDWETLVMSDVRFESV